MPSYRWKNKETNEIRDWTSRIADREKFLETVEDPELWARVPEALASRTRLSASYVDGVTPPDRKEVLNRTKEKLAVQIESYNKPHDQRGEHNKEIKKLENT